MVYKTFHKLDIVLDLDLEIITDRQKTICECTYLDYKKLIARHEPSPKKTLKKLHESVEHLFQQYIDDAKNNI